MKVFDDNIIIHVVDQMYESDWFSEETITKWEETNNNSKTLHQCQQFFEDAYIARKRYIKTKGSIKESINKIMTADWNLYLEALEAELTQDKKEQEEHIQQVIQQNATLITMVQEQQKKLE